MTDKEMKLERFKEENKNAVKGQIVLTGSSLMEMFPVNKFLAERGSDIIVYNRAIGGYITDELMQVLDTCVFELEPRRVFINIGTNDLSDSRIPMDRIMEHYDSIISSIEQRLPKTEIYLMAYYPVNYEAAAEKYEGVPENPHKRKDNGGKRTCKTDCGKARSALYRYKRRP